MTAEILELVSAYGAYVIFITCFLSCLLIPVPSSLLMLAGGAFTASGDLALLSVAGGAYAGAVLGDQAGFRLGRIGEPALNRLTRDRPRRAAVRTRATRFLDQHGGPGVFLSTWLFAPLGPWVNMIAGATGMSWARFTLWDAAGEAVWVSLYVGLGRLFAGQLSAVATALSNGLGLVTALAVLGFLGLTLRDALRARKHP